MARFKFGRKKKDSDPDSLFNQSSPDGSPHQKHLYVKRHSKSPLKSHQFSPRASLDSSLSEPEPPIQEKMPQAVPQPIQKEEAPSGPAPNNSTTPWKRHKLFDSPFPRYRHAVSQISSEKNEIFLMGGLKEGSVFGDTWRIVPLVSLDQIDRFMASHVEIANNNIPPARVGHAAVLCGNAFIVYAGDTVDTDIDGCPDDNFYMFNINNCKYTVPLHVLNKPKGRYGHLIGVVLLSAKSSKLYMFGGQLELEVFDDLYYFELTLFKLPKSRWEIVEPANGLKPPPLTNHSMSVYKSKIYVFGGVYNNEKVSNDLWCFDTVANKWLQLTTTGLAPLPVNEHSAVIANDRLYLYGGNDFAGIIYDSLYCLDLRTLHWTKLAKDVSSGGPGPRCGHTMTYMPNLNKIVIMGGDKNDYILSDPHDFETHEEYGLQELGTMIFELDVAVADHFLRGGAAPKKVAASAAGAGALAGKRATSPAPSEDTQGRHRRSFSAGPEDFRTPTGSQDHLPRSLDPRYPQEEHLNPDVLLDSNNFDDTRDLNVPQRESTISAGDGLDRFVEVPSSTVSQHETTSDLDDMRDQYFAQLPATRNNGGFLPEEDEDAKYKDTPILSKDFANHPSPPLSPASNIDISRESSFLSGTKSPNGVSRAAVAATPTKPPVIREEPDNERTKKIIQELNSQLEALQLSSKRDMEQANARIAELELSQSTLSGNHERQIQEKDSLIEELKRSVNPADLEINDEDAEEQSGAPSSRGFTELTKYKLDRLEMRNRLVYLETENSQLRDKFERFEPYMNNQIGELTTLQKVIKGQEDKIALLSLQVVLEQALHKEIAEWKHKYEDLLVEHTNFKAMHTDVEVSDDDAERGLDGAGNTRSSKQISSHLERLVLLWETSRRHDDDVRLIGSQDSQVVSQLQRQVDELMKTSKTQHEGSAAEVKALEAEVLAKLQALKQYEENYRDALQSVNNTHKALQLTNEELRNQKLLIEKLVKENNELRLFKKANSRFSTRGDVSNGSSPIPGTPQLEEDEFGFTSAHYNMKLKDMEADLYILKQERDQLNEKVASLKKELYLAQNA